mgnify:CR=1 FL=1
MIWNREEYIAHMNFSFTGKEMFAELFGPLIGLPQEWREQGATEDEINLSKFGWDHVLYTWPQINIHEISGIKPKIIEDNSEYTISLDALGRQVKLCKKSATIPLPLSYPVKTMDDWLNIKHYYEFNENRVDIENLKRIKQLQDKGYLVIGSCPGGFDTPRQLMGEEELCIAYYEQPELIIDILKTMKDMAIKVYERVFEIVNFDVLSVHEDLAGKSGPLVGPKQIQEFIKPYYRGIWDYVSNNNCTIFSQDSDGDITSVIDSFIDCGVTTFYPCEPAAGMDIVKIREKYPKLSLKGGIDKFVLLGTKNDILRELEYKMNGCTRKGGTIFALDHRIPNGTPIENYRYYVEKGCEILEIPKREKSEFIRMAF